jgi:MtN3 and saliva related transmembrane protein
MSGSYITALGIVAGFCTAVSMLPQLIMTIRERKAGNISILTIITLIFGLALWICYGILIRDLPVIIANSFSFSVNTVLLFFRLKYGKS